MLNSKEIYSDTEKEFMLKVVRSVIESELKNEQFSVDLKLVPDIFLEIRSCFVTLYTEDGLLRGCIGNIEPFEYLIDNIMHNAYNAAFRDPRFPPLSDLEELNLLKIEISILTVPEIVDSYEDIEIGRHGVILKKQGFNSVFLPQVALEQGWDLNETLTHLSLKAGLSRNAWKEPDCEFRVFEAIYFKE